jgi:hypothetical protein
VAEEPLEVRPELGRVVPDRLEPVLVQRHVERLEPVPGRAPQVVLVGVDEGQLARPAGGDEVGVGAGEPADGQPAEPADGDDQDDGPLGGGLGGRGHTHQG